MVAWLIGLLYEYYKHKHTYGQFPPESVRVEKTKNSDDFWMLFCGTQNRELAHNVTVDFLRNATGGPSERSKKQTVSA